VAIIAGSFAFNVIFILTLFIVVLKAILIAILVKTIFQKKKKEQIAGLYFIYGIISTLAGLLIGRIFFIFFDFHYTKFNTNLYYLLPQIWFWKLGCLFSSGGLAIFIFLLDLKVLNKKYKGVFGYITLISSLIVFCYPVHSEFDFQITSWLLIFPNLSIFFIGILFLNIGRRLTGEIKKRAFIMFTAIVLYGIAVFIVNAGLIATLSSLFGENTDLIMYTIQAILKAIGLILLTNYGSKISI